MGMMGPMEPIVPISPITPITPMSPIGFMSDLLNLGRITTMNSRERLQMALNHQQPDRPPVDLGATAVTGAHFSIVHKLRQACGLSVAGDRAVKVTEPYQMLGQVEADLMDALGVDCIGLGLTRTMIGWKNEGWRPWVSFQGIPCLVPEKFNTTPEADGPPAPVARWRPQLPRQRGDAQGRLLSRHHRAPAADR